MLCFGVFELVSRSPLIQSLINVLLISISRRYWTVFITSCITKCIISLPLHTKCFTTFVPILTDFNVILEITLICNHINKNLHLQRTQKFYILQLFLHCFLHSTTWFWPKSTSTSTPKFYILQVFFTHFLLSTSLFWVNSTFYI